MCLMHRTLLPEHNFNSVTPVRRGIFLGDDMKNFFQFRFSAEKDTAEIATPVYLRKHGETKGEQKANAIWDTGATSSMISAAMAKKLQLTPNGTVQIAGVHGVQNARCYYVDIVFGNGFCIPAVKVSEASDFGGFDLLIGMDIIGKGALVVDGTQGNLIVRFQLPAE